MFKLVIAFAALCAVASAGFIGGYGHVGHGLSYSSSIVPAYHHSSYVQAPHYVQTYSAPIVPVPVVRSVAPVATYRTYKVVESVPVHAVPVVYASHGYSGHYGKR